MKVTSLFALLSLFVSSLSFSQSDTTYKYFSKAYKETTKDSAFTYVKFYKQGNLWHGAEYFMKKGGLKSEGNYLQMSFETPTGSFNNYTEAGKLDNIAEFADGKVLQKTFYYKTGDKKSWILYSDKGVQQQKGWDETGKEIKNYVVEREARFKGGMEGWRRYMEKHLNANVAADAGAPEGDYPVQVQFIVSKEGYASNVKAVSIPLKCKPCASEAVRVISEGPEWEPAIQNNEPVLYQAVQYVTFQVMEDKKKRKN